MNGNTSISAFIASLASQGATFIPLGDTLRIEGLRNPSPELVAEITERKPAILGYLEQQQRVSEMVAALLVRLNRGMDCLRELEEKGEQEGERYIAWFAEWHRVLLDYEKHAHLLLVEPAEDVQEVAA